MVFRLVFREDLSVFPIYLLIYLLFKNKSYIFVSLLKKKGIMKTIELERLVSYATYGKMIGHTQQHVRNLVASDKIKSISIDGRLFVVLTDKELKERVK